MQRRCVDDAIIFHRLLQCCSTHGVGGDRHPHCSEKVGHVWTNLLCTKCRNQTASPLCQRTQGGQGDQGECCHAYPLPQATGTPLDPNETVFIHITVYVRLCFYVIRSFLPSVSGRLRHAHYKPPSLGSSSDPGIDPDPRLGFSFWWSKSEPGIRGWHNPSTVAAIRPQSLPLKFISVKFCESFLLLICDVFT